MLYSTKNCASFVKKTKFVALTAVTGNDLQKIADTATQRHNNHDLKQLKLVVGLDFVYHIYNYCYKNVTNKAKLENLSKPQKCRSRPSYADAGASTYQSLSI